MDTKKTVLAAGDVTLLRQPERRKYLARAKKGTKRKQVDSKEIA